MGADAPVPVSWPPHATRGGILRDPASVAFRPEPRERPSPRERKDSRIQPRRRCSIGGPTVQPRSRDRTPIRPTLTRPHAHPSTTQPHAHQPRAHQTGAHQTDTQPQQPHAHRHHTHATPRTSVHHATSATRCASDRHSLIREGTHARRGSTLYGPNTPHSPTATPTKPTPSRIGCDDADRL